MVLCNLYKLPGNLCFPADSPGRGNALFNRTKTQFPYAAVLLFRARVSFLIVSLSLLINRFRVAEREKGKSQPGFCLSAVIIRPLCTDGGAF